MYVVRMMHFNKIDENLILASHLQLYKHAGF